MTEDYIWEIDYDLMPCKRKVIKRTKKTVRVEGIPFEAIFSLSSIYESHELCALACLKKIRELIEFEKRYIIELEGKIDKIIGVK